MITCDNLTKRYGTVTAVDSLSLQVPAGELFGFLGPNGAGKTTTIKMLVGMLRPDSGRATIAGIDIGLKPVEAKRKLGFVPDTPNIYGKLTGREFLAFVAELRGLGTGALDYAEELLALFELNDRANELLGGYSHGMKQKICLAGALLPDPDVLFLDEPTVGLDPRSARIMKDVLRQKVRQGKTVFMSTHILEIAERICDRVGIIQNGRMVAVGTMDELRRSNQNGATGATLEDLFLALTGGSAVEDLSKHLED